MTLYLHTLSGATPRPVYRLDDGSSLRVGRGPDCDIHLDDANVSKEHCRLEVRAGRVRIADTHSRNGTWVGGPCISGQRVSTPVEIGPGVTLNLAGSFLELRLNALIQERTHETTTSLKRLTKFLPGQGGARKLRLLACAWLRHLGCGTDRYGRLIDAAEAVADSRATVEELSQARDETFWPGHSGWQVIVGPDDLRLLAQPSPRAAVRRVLDVAQGFASVGGVGEDLLGLARDALGDFFHPFQARPDWLTWNDGTVGKLARGIYDRCGFEDMPILADALEEAGCDDGRVLRHCRAGGRHARGCWVLDGVLGTPRPRINDPGSRVTTGPAN